MNSQATLQHKARVILLAVLAAASLMFPARADVGDAAKLKTVLLDGKPVSLDSA